MRSFKILISLILLIILNNSAFSKVPINLIKEIVNEASIILSSSDPVESKIIKLNDIAERNVILMVLLCTHLENIEKFI